MFEQFKELLIEEFQVEDGVSLHIATASGGDVRKSLNAVELCVLSANPPKENEKRIISLRYQRAKTTEGFSFYGTMLNKQEIEEIF